MNSEMTQEAFLERVRRRLIPGEPAGAALAPQTAEEPPSLADLVTRFCRAVERNGGRVYRAADARQAARQVQDILASTGARRVTMARDARLADLDLSSASGLLELRAADQVQTRALADFDTAITGADKAIAQTGTLVLVARPGQPRLQSAFPQVHIGVIHADCIVPEFAQVADFMRKIVRETPSITFVSGPSRTGDIEQTITIGAHGPRELHVVVRDD